LPPNAFVKQQNRATAESEKDRALQEGQAPRLDFLKGICDILISDFGPEYSENFEWAWKENKNQDPKEQADVLKELVGSGIKTINEGRADLGLDPIAGGDAPMALTPTGYVPLDAFEQNMQQQADNNKMQADARAQATQNGAATAVGQNVAGKSADSDGMRKAVTRHAAPSFRPAGGASGYSSRDRQGASGAGKNVA
jgi:hypothetical protein